MNLTAEQIQDNWNELMSRIDIYIPEPRKSKLKAFYEKYADRIILMPASHKKEYHSAFPGGYVDHVLRVIDASLDIHNIWVKYGVDTTTYTLEELVFSALNHDLGKIGNEQYESYIPQTDQWRKDKLGEDYTFNSRLEFASVPDRSLYLLQSHDIKYSFNEMITIQTHDGLYDEGNKKYLVSFIPENKPRTSLPYIVHQADLMAARIEFEKEWLPKLNNVKESNKSQFTLETKKSAPATSDKKAKALGSLKSEGLKNMLDNL